MGRILPLLLRLTLRDLRRQTRAGLRRFLRSTAGGLTVETALLMPMLSFFYVAGFVWFDAFRAQNLTLKATYTVADMISRETVPLTDTYMNGLQTVYDYMTRPSQTTSLRITAVKCSGNCDDDITRTLEVCWSWASGTATPHDAASFQAVADAVPLMVLGDTAVITETAFVYEPAFNVLVDTNTLSHLLVTRPRFVPQVIYDDQRCY